jgi:hypothetical protein
MALSGNQRHADYHHVASAPCYQATNAPLMNWRYNKSLDASGTSGLVIDNLSVTWLSPAASTQPVGLLL